MRACDTGKVRTDGIAPCANAVFLPVRGPMFTLTLGPRTALRIELRDARVDETLCALHPNACDPSN